MGSYVGSTVGPFGRGLVIINFTSKDQRLAASSCRDASGRGCLSAGQVPRKSRGKTNLGSRSVLPGEVMVNRVLLGTRHAKTSSCGDAK